METRRIRRELGQDIEKFLAVVKDDSVCARVFVARAREALAASARPPDVVQRPDGDRRNRTGRSAPGGTITMMPDEPVTD